MIWGGSRAIPACSAHQVYHQSHDNLGTVSHQPLPRAQGHSIEVQPVIASYLGEYCRGTLWVWDVFRRDLLKLCKSIIVYSDTAYRSPTSSGSSSLHSQLGLLTLGCRRKMFMLCLVFKYSKKQINLDEHRPDMVLRRRHKVKMKLAFSNKGRVLKSPYYLAVHLWNQLEVDVQTSICKKDFRQKLYFIDFNNLSICLV